MEPTIPSTQAFGLRRYHIRILIAVIIIFAGFLGYLYQPSSKFPSETLIRVESGATLTSVAHDLKAKHVVRSSTLFKIAVVLSGGEGKLQAGDYYLGKPLSVRGVASRLVAGNFDLASFKITVPEGITMEQMAALFSSKLPDFSSDEFMKNWPAKEGFLFPDTYFFLPNATTEDVISTLEKTYAEKIKTVGADIIDSGKTEKEIVTMASILEEEAKKPEDWSIISGILWKRIKIGMALQVDATLGYVTGRGSSELTADDLKKDSPYNTYTRRGLPPTPISNPGLGTIKAAITPTTTPYLYYLSDENGDIHYAATFEQHKQNREKYLDN